MTTSRIRGRRPRRAPAALPTAEPQVVLLAGAKAGQGTSTVAALLGIVAAAEGRRVLLVDAGRGDDSLSGLLGVEPSAGRMDEDALLEEQVVPVSDTLALLSVGERPAGERRALLRWIAPLYARYDLVVVDAGCALESILGLCSTPLGRVVAVATCDRLAITATYALVKVLHSRGLDVPVEILLNTAHAPAALTAFRELEAGTRLFLQRGLDYAGAVPDDAGLRARLLAGVPVQQAAIDSPVVPAIQQLGARLRRELSNKSHAVSEPRLSTWR